MPVTVTYPGVYVSEVPSSAAGVTAVPTSTAAFVGWFPRGPVGRATRIDGLAQFEAEFGGLHRESEAAYAVHQFFANGGADAWIVRLVTDAQLAATAIPIHPPSDGMTAPQTIDAPDHAGRPAVANVEGDTDAKLIVTAANPGGSGNALRVFIAIDPGGTFSLAVSETADAGGTTVSLTREDYRGLTLTPGAVGNALEVVNGRSSLISLSVAGSPIAAGAYPAATGGDAASTPLEIWVALTGGVDGALPTIADLDPSATPAAREPGWLDQLTAIASDDFDLLCIPDTIDLPADAAKIVFDAANAFCIARMRSTCSTFRQR
ncbi:hypothetical protein KZX46_13090 [Polymorphobacter sp. PAMC 29334]|uniref:hypothetical protein n=1 Tax=Polymorphobacter sp. PAMC 29334 TaxID=2862331 RepID=UPI001C78CA56|nr:hypothetical protein [Polymorphobacter sp. PAMC 29334]QYE33772.1 hypothetical protein KZX46_13090 [Polymorphobacter sp. PAMC 29334]